MRKIFITLIVVSMTLLISGFVFAAEIEEAPAVVYTTNYGDRLGNIAEKYLGDKTLAVEIVFDTNNMAYRSSFFTQISGADRIVPGKELYIGGVEPEISRPRYAYTEEVITFKNKGQKVVGTLVKPVKDGPHPVIVLFHGFTGSRDELPVKDTDEGLFSRAARIFAERGFASLRIDFRGSGESEGEWVNTTFSGQISDAAKAVDYVAKLDDIDDDRIGLFGYSQGGLVASSVAAHDSRIKSVVLLAPVANPPATYATVLGQETLDAALNSEGEPVTGTLPWGAETTLNPAFFKELYEIDPIAEITNYGGPLMVIVGTEDTIVAPQPQYGQLYLKYHEGYEQLVMLPVNHAINCFQGYEQVDNAIFWSLNWYKDTLF